MSTAPAPSSKSLCALAQRKAKHNADKRHPFLIHVSPPIIASLNAFNVA